MLLEFIFNHLLQIGLTIGVLLLCVAYLTLFERKVIAAMQYRTGPALNGPFGLLQPLMDGVKLLLKEINLLKNLPLAILIPIALLAQES